MKKDLLKSFEQKLDAMRQLLPEPPAVIQELEQSIKHPVSTLKRNLIKELRMDADADAPERGREMGL